MREIPVYLMSPPSPDWTVRARANVFSQRAAPNGRPLGPQAIRDWLHIAQHIERAGGRVLVLPTPVHQSLTGLPYTAEAGAFFVDKSHQPNLILPNVKPPHRQPEAGYIAGFAAALGWRLHHVPVLWEGQGDAIRVDAERIVHTSGEGAASRTSPDAAALVAPRLSSRHLHLRFRAAPWFHGNTFLGVFHHARTNEPTVLVCPAALLPGEFERLKEFCAGLRVVEITDEESLSYTTNSLQVVDTVIAPTGLPPRIHALWKDLGLSIVELELDALFRHGGGAAVCLTNRLDGCSADAIPPHLRLDTWAPSLLAQVDGRA